MFLLKSLIKNMVTVTMLGIVNAGLLLLVLFFKSKSSPCIQSFFVNIKHHGIFLRVKWVHDE